MGRRNLRQSVQGLQHAVIRFNTSGQVLPQDGLESDRVQVVDAGQMAVLNQFGQGVLNDRPEILHPLVSTFRDNRLKLPFHLKETVLEGGRSQVGGEYLHSGKQADWRASDVPVP